MSARHTAMDRKARRALMMVGVMLLVVLALALWSFIARLSENNTLTSPASKDERLVVIDKQTMVLEPGALGQTLASWLRSGEEKTLSFELSDRSFEANSATPTALTMGRIRQVAAVTKASPTIMVHILKPIDVDSAASGQLEEQRAARLFEEFVASGVSESRVTIEPERNDLPFAKSPYLAVLLSKGAIG